MVISGLIQEGQVLPLLVRPSGLTLALSDWARQHLDWIEERLLDSGALLFRDFAVDSVEGFNEFVHAVSGEPLEYRERSSPRSQVVGNIYTSTDYPAKFSIFLHNENSYSSSWPMKLFFYCDTPASEGGQTPLADSRKIFQRIDPAIRERFIEKGVMYVRNFGQGLGLSWPTVFQTTDPAVVEDYCRKAGIAVEWKEDGGLRTKHVGQAVATHPRSGELVWFNHGTFFHVSTLDPMIRDMLLDSYPADELPNNTFYGDGAPIEASVLDELRAAYAAETVMFDWAKGDIMVVDNMLTAHGRAPYVGSRLILVAMAQPIVRGALV